MTRFYNHRENRGKESHNGVLSYPHPSLECQLVLTIALTEKILLHCTDKEIDPVESSGGVKPYLSSDLTAPK